MEVAAQQAFDDEKLGGEFGINRGVAATGNWQDRQQHAEHQNEGQAPDEIRHGEHETIESVDEFFDGTAAPGC